MVSPPDIVTTGGVIIDNVAMANGAVRRGQIGGNALYAAAGAALWGLRCGVCAHVPANYPVDALAGLTARGLDLTGVSRASAEVEQEEWFFYAADGSRRDQLFARPDEADAAGITEPAASPVAIAAFEAQLARRQPDGLTFGAFRRAHPIAPSDMPPAFWQARGLHLAANGVAEQIALAASARTRGLTVSWDPGPRVGEFSPDHLAAILGMIDAALPSETELNALRPGLGPARGLMALRPLTRGLLAVKLGARGALMLALGMDEPRLVPALPTEVVDPTGAGDTFCGGVLAGLILGDDAHEAIRRGIAGASAAVSTRGPVALLEAAPPSSIPA